MWRKHFLTLYESVMVEASISSQVDLSTPKQKEKDKVECFCIYIYIYITNFPSLLSKHAR